MSDILAVIRWLLALELLGWGLYPLLYFLMPGLRDRGLTISKPLALLLTVFPVWFIAALGLPAFVTPLLITIFVALSVLGWLLAWRDHRQPRSTDHAFFSFLRGSWRYVILAEAIFLLSFCGYLLIRRYNPQILGTEKPMEMAFLAAATRDTTMPPHDPWLSGYTINYYYLGYVLIAALTKTTAISSSVAFNLGLATIFALALLGGTGVLANLLALAQQPTVRLPRASTLAAGLLGGYLLMLAGNMYATRDILEHGRAAIDNWWWGGLGWKSSRVVIDSGFPPAIFGPNTAPSETITEFPYFSFILGDLHAHILALPYTLIALSLALDSYVAPLITADVAGGWRRFFPSWHALLRLALAALVIGGLYALNSWDLPTYAGIYLLAGALPLVVAQRKLQPRHWIAAALFLTGAVGFYLPFYARFTSLVGGQVFDLPPAIAAIPLVSKLSAILGLVIWGKTPADQFFTVYLLPWLAALLFMVWRWYNGPRQAKPNFTQASLFVLAIGLVATLLQMPVCFFAGLILLLAGAILRQWQREEAARDPLATIDLFVIILFGSAFALVLVTEVFFIHDIFGNRMNTIFKVYYQVWTLLAVAGGYAIIRIVRWQPRRRSDQWRIPATLLFILLLVATSAYPIYSTRARTEQFLNAGSLDGLDFIRHEQPAEWAGITWVRDNLPASAVVAEAPGCSYGEARGMPHDRVATFAGVSTPLGWGGHEAQWRGGSPQLVATLGPRGEAINRLYSTVDPAEATAILDRYGIDYVYVGLFERAGYSVGGIGADCRAGGGYPAAGLAKFATMMEQVFRSQDGTVTIYQRR